MGPWGLPYEQLPLGIVEKSMIVYLVYFSQIIKFVYLNLVNSEL